jgi:hypothetical protein
MKIILIVSTMHILPFIHMYFDCRPQMTFEITAFRLATLLLKFMFTFSTAVSINTLCYLHARRFNTSSSFVINKYI